MRDPAAHAARDDERGRERRSVGEEYNQIVQLMNSDPQIRESIMERLNAGEGS